MKSDLGYVTVSDPSKSGWRGSTSAVDIYNRHVAYIESLPECGGLDMNPVVAGPVEDANSFGFTVRTWRPAVDSYFRNEFGKYNYLREESWG